MSEEEYRLMWRSFKSLGQDALSMNHYDLAKKTNFSPDLWKEFLMDQEVIDYVSLEQKLLMESELKKLVKDVSNSRSVGQAQLINAIAKQSEDRGIKDGPVFIYTYVPPNAQQAQAENIAAPTKDDIFMKGE